MTLKEIAAYLSIRAETLKHGVRVYLWRESDDGLPCHVFDSLDAAVSEYGDEQLYYRSTAVHIDNESVVFWLH